MIRRPPRSTRTEHSFPTRRSSDLFLLPIFLMLIERSGLVTREQLVSARRYMIVAAFAIAAVATPPDILSQFLLAVPLILLYELSLFAIWFTQRRSNTGPEEGPVGPREEA